MRMLFVVDCSSSFEEAVREITWRLRPSATSVCVLMVVNKVVPPAATLWHDAKGSLDHVRHLIKWRAEVQVEQIAAVLRASGFTVETRVRYGNLLSAMISEARQWKARQLVVGISSYTGIKPWLLQLAFRRLVPNNGFTPSSINPQEPQQPQRKAA